MNMTAEIMVESETLLDRGKADIYSIRFFLMWLHTQTKT